MSGEAAKPTARFDDVRWLGEVDSTNVRLAALARAGEAAPDRTVLVADHQGAGRGRRGRTWESPPGSSLLVSVLLGAPGPDLAQLTTVCVALAAADACRGVAGVSPTLKWPNDVMVGDDKLGGILAEAVTPVSVVVGLGLNVDWGVAPLPEGATSLARASGAPGQTVDRAALLTSYLRHLDHRCAALDDPSARPALLGDYRRACATLGRAVAVDLGLERLEGTATGVTDEGSLLVETSDGTREVSAGDVVHVNIP